MDSLVWSGFWCWVRGGEVRLDGVANPSAGVVARDRRLMQLPTSQTTRAVLEAVNTLRTAHGLKPVQSLARGCRFDVYGCPLSNSLSWGTTLRIAIIPGAYRWGLTKTGAPAACESLPRVLENFRREFDAGEYPGLCLRRP
jgi:hypothetical protein